MSGWRLARVRWARRGPRPWGRETSATVPKPACRQAASVSVKAPPLRSALQAIVRPVDRPLAGRSSAGYAGDKPRSFSPRPPRGEGDNAERPKRAFGADRPEGSRDGPRPDRPPRVGKRERAELKEREARGDKPFQSDRPSRSERPYGASGKPTRAPGRQDGRSGDRPYSGPKGAPQWLGSGGGTGRPPRGDKPKS